MASADELRHTREEGGGEQGQMMNTIFGSTLPSAPGCWGAP